MERKGDFFLPIKEKRTVAFFVIFDKPPGWGKRGTRLQRNPSPFQTHYDNPFTHTPPPPLRHITPAQNIAKSEETFIEKWSQPPSLTRFPLPPLSLYTPHYRRAVYHGAHIKRDLSASLPTLPVSNAISQKKKKKKKKKTYHQKRFNGLDDHSRLGRRNVCVMGPQNWAESNLWQEVRKTSEFENVWGEGRFR